MKKYDNKVNYLSVGVRTKRKMFQADVGVPANIERAYHKAIGEDANGGSIVLKGIYLVLFPAIGGDNTK